MNIKNLSIRRKQLLREARSLPPSERQDLMVEVNKITQEIDKASASGQKLGVETAYEMLGH